MFEHVFGIVDAGVGTNDAEYWGDAVSIYIRRIPSFWRRAGVLSVELVKRPQRFQILGIVRVQGAKMSEPSKLK